MFIFTEKNASIRNFSITVRWKKRIQEKYCSISISRFQEKVQDAFYCIISMPAVVHPLLLAAVVFEPFQGKVLELSTRNKIMYVTICHSYKLSFLKQLSISITTQDIIYTSQGIKTSTCGAAALRIFTNCIAFIYYLKQIFLCVLADTSLKPLLESKGSEGCKLCVCFGCNW